MNNKKIDPQEVEESLMEAEINAKKENALEMNKETHNQLETIQNNAELAKMYVDNAQVGADNLSGETPLLKVHAVGRSKNELADGSEPDDGAFFYKPTGEQFESIECHVLTISRGYKAPGLEEGGKEIFNQLLGGVIMHEGQYKPFIMYFTGLKLSNLWEFGKIANKYTHAKPMPIPMFALMVRLTTEKVNNSYGKSWIVNFEIVKNGDGTPKLVLDQGEFQFLKDSADLSQETMESLIKATEIKKVEPEKISPVTAITEADMVELEGNHEPLPF